jgi:tRNA (adenine57-N1/adenine58-N1)-methyltransferase
MKVLISLKTGIYYYYKSKGDFHTKEGYLKEEDLLSEKKVLLSNTNRKFLCFDSNEYDKRLKIKRGAQIVTPKDIGYIISRTGITKNSIVLEAGTGSGAFGINLAQLVKKVKSYEINESHYEIAKKNIENFALKNISLKLGDVCDYIEKEKGIDLLFLDMPEPQIVIEKKLTAVKSGAFIVAYLPSISQIINLLKTTKDKEDLYVEEISEVNVREWKVNDRIARPQFRKEIDHTAFLCFIRKI